LHRHPRQRLPDGGPLPGDADRPARAPVRALRHTRSAARVRSRPLLFTSYASDAGLLPTTTKRIAVGVLLVGVILAPFGRVPLLGFLGGAGWHLVLAQVLVFAICALGLNILTGLAGQVSVGHPFLLGERSYAAV